MELVAIGTVFFDSLSIFLVLVLRQLENSFSFFIIHATHTRKINETQLLKGTQNYQMDYTSFLVQLKV